MPGSISTACLESKVSDLFHDQERPLAEYDLGAETGVKQRSGFEDRNSRQEEQWVQ
jgi:hypothetical protein